MIFLCSHPNAIVLGSDDGHDMQWLHPVPTQEADKHPYAVTIDRLIRQSG